MNTRTISSLIIFYFNMTLIALQSHLDKMLSEITAFVEGKIKRRRVKTGCPPGIRFGPSTVHVYDPLVSSDFVV